MNDNTDINHGVYIRLQNYIDLKIPADIQFKIPLITYKHLLSIISSLDATKATGLNGVSAKNDKTNCSCYCTIFAEDNKYWYLERIVSTIT